MELANKMICATCNIQTSNKKFCSQKCNTVRTYSYETHSYCRRCYSWKDKGVKCKDCNYTLRNSKRFKKNEDRWKKAY